MPVLRSLALLFLTFFAACGPGGADGSIATDDDDIDVWGDDSLDQELVNGPTISAAADTFVQGGSYADKNYGRSSTVRADQSSSSPRVGYVRFDLSQITAPIQRARLRIYVTNQSKNAADFVAISNTTWDEATVTWNSRPSVDGQVIASLGSVSEGSYTTVDVSGAVRPGEILSLAVNPRSRDGFAFASRNASESRRPVLLIDFADGADAGTSGGAGGTCEGGTCPSNPVDGGSIAPQPSCGDATCSETETCTTCAADCGACPPTSGSPADACLARTSKTVLKGTYTSDVDLPSPPDNHAVDARAGLSLTSGARALEIGSNRTSNGMCVIGWTTIGQQSRTLSWRYMHDQITGSALRVYGSNYLVDGLRADNVEDGFDPRGGEGFELRNAWMSYIRDDCIENDELREGKVVDSLFDGCYTFFSEQETGSAVGESLVFENVLVRLQAQPGPRGTEDPNVLGHGSIFKKFKYGGRHEPVIRDSIFWLEDDCNGGCEAWPAGTKATNVTILWTGAGKFPMTLLPGMTLTTDRKVWDTAVAKWKARHGCTTIDQPCTKLHNPDPY